jgi:hypothetical protein
MARPKRPAKEYVGEIGGKKYANDLKRQINRICGFSAVSARQSRGVFKIYVAKSCLRRHSLSSVI